MTALKNAQFILDALRLSPTDPSRGKKRLEAAEDPELFLLYYLFAAKNWGLRDLKALYEGRDGWTELVRAFAAHQAERRSEGFK